MLYGSYIHYSKYLIIQEKDSDSNDLQSFVSDFLGLPDNAYLDGLTHEPEKLTYHRVHRVSQGKICFTQSSRSTQRSAWIEVYKQEI